MDCDGDDLLDSVCYDLAGNRGIIGSGIDCTDTWPSVAASYCPPVFNGTNASYDGHAHGHMAMHIDARTTTCTQILYCL